MKKLMLIFVFREYGVIDDVDIDLYIDVSFFDVSIILCSMISVFKNICIFGRNLIFVFFIMLLVIY